MRRRSLLSQPEDAAHQLRQRMLFRGSSVGIERADRAVQNLAQNAFCESFDDPALSGLERAEFTVIALKLLRSNLLQPPPESDDGEGNFSRSDGSHGTLDNLGHDLLGPGGLTPAPRVPGFRYLLKVIYLVDEALVQFIILWDSLRGRNLPD
jgi:hypothetical protein